MTMQSSASAARTGNTTKRTATAAHLTSDLLVIRVLLTEQHKKLTHFVDDGIGLDRSRHCRIATPDCSHPCSTRARHVYFRIVTHKDSVGGTGIESFQCTMKYP